MINFQELPVFQNFHGQTKILLHFMYICTYVIAECSIRITLYILTALIKCFVVQNAVGVYVLIVPSNPVR